QGGGVIPTTQPPLVPALLVQIPEGVVALAGKAEEPVPRRVGGDVSLVDPADGEGLHNPLVGPLTGHRVLLVERALMLVHHNPILPEGFIAVAIELPGEQALPRTKGVGGVHDDQVVAVLGGADKPEPVLVVDVDP